MRKYVIDLIFLFDDLVEYIWVVKLFNRSLINLYIKKQYIYLFIYFPSIFVWGFSFVGCYFA